MGTHAGDRNHSQLPVAGTSGSRSLVFPPSLQLYEDDCRDKGTHNLTPSALPSVLLPPLVWRQAQGIRACLSQLLLSPTKSTRPVMGDLGWLKGEDPQLAQRPWSLRRCMSEEGSRNHRNESWTPRRPWEPGAHLETQEETC